MILILNIFSWIVILHLNLSLLSNLSQFVHLHEYSRFLRMVFQFLFILYDLLNQLFIQVVFPIIFQFLWLLSLFLFTQLLIDLRVCFLYFHFSFDLQSTQFDLLSLLLINLSYFFLLNYQFIQSFLSIHFSYPSLLFFLFSDLLIDFLLTLLSIFLFLQSIFNILFLQLNIKLNLIINHFLFPFENLLIIKLTFHMNLAIWNI